MTEHEANMKFCEFIKSNFGFDPVPIPFNRLDSLYRERAVFFVHNASQARELGFNFHGNCEENIIISPYWDYTNESEAFEYFDYDVLKTNGDFSRIKEDYELWVDEEEDFCLFDDISEYLRAYYIVTDCMSVINIDELI